MEGEKLMPTRRSHNLFEGGIPRTYDKLCLAHAPRPIHDQIDYDNTIEIIDALAGLPLNRDQEDYLYILARQIEEYEKATVPPAPKLSALEMLRTVCEETGISQAAFARILDVSESLISLIFRGDRKITIDLARKLGSHFGIDPTLFIDV
jgi:HTH-type transcriptional regulator / antitoxin HigA